MINIFLNLSSIYHNFNLSMHCSLDTNWCFSIYFSWVKFIGSVNSKKCFILTLLGYKRKLEQREKVQSDVNTGDAPLKVITLHFIKIMYFRLCILKLCFSFNFSGKFRDESQDFNFLVLWFCMLWCIKLPYNWYIV